MKKKLEDFWNNIDWGNTAVGAGTGLVGSLLFNRFILGNKSWKSRILAGTIGSLLGGGGVALYNHYNKSGYKPKSINTVEQTAKLPKQEQSLVAGIPGSKNPVAREIHADKKKRTAEDKEELALRARAKKEEDNPTLATTAALWDKGGNVPLQTYGGLVLGNSIDRAGSFFTRGGRKPAVSLGGKVYSTSMPSKSNIFWLGDNTPQLDDKTFNKVTKATSAKKDLIGRVRAGDIKLTPEQQKTLGYRVPSMTSATVDYVKAKMALSKAQKQHNLPPVTIAKLNLGVDISKSVLDGARKRLLKQQAKHLFRNALGGLSAIYSISNVSDNMERRRQIEERKGRDKWLYSK